MANMRRWNPRRPSVWDRDVFDEMDRMFEDPFFGRGSRAEGQNWGLPLDVAENENVYIIHASIPGIDPDDVDVSISDNVLTIRGEMSGEMGDENDRYVLRERRMGSFTRSVSFPMAVDADRVEATCSNGVLTLRLPKAETARPRRISIGNRGGRQIIEGQQSAARGVQTSAGGGIRTERGAIGDSRGWPEGQADTDVPSTERNREGQGWTEGVSATNREERAPQSGGWTEGQSETWDEKTPHSSGWTEGQRGKTNS